MRVKLIVTGDLERRALATSLARAFPTTHDGAPIEFVLRQDELFATVAGTVVSGADERGRAR